MKLKKVTFKYLDGSSSEYYKNLNSQYHGPYTWFYPNDQKHWEGSWIFGRYIGVWKRYKKDGRRWYIDTRKNDRLNGVMIEFK